MKQSTICPKCKGHDNVVKKGKRKTKYNIIQRYWCNRCKYRFTIESEFNKAKFDPTVIKQVVSLWGLGLSTRQISNHFQTALGIKITHVTVLRWIKKFYMSKDFDKFEKAKEFAKKSNIKSKEQWQDAWVKGKIPQSIPKFPDRVYN